MNTIEMTRSMESGMKVAMQEFARSVVHSLGKKYDFDVDEAVKEFVNVDIGVSRSKTASKVKEKKRMTPSFPLPWCGSSDDTCCTALRLNHGLYTQCMNAPIIDGEYCKTCQKQADGGNGSAVYGTVNDRMKVDALEYRDPKGKLVVTYGIVMSKLNISRE